MSKEGCTFGGVLPKMVSKTFLVVFCTGRNSALKFSNMGSCHICQEQVQDTHAVPVSSFSPGFHLQYKLFPVSILGRSCEPRHCTPGRDEKEDGAGKPASPVRDMAPFQPQHSVPSSLQWLNRGTTTAPTPAMLSHTPMTLLWQHAAPCSFMGIPPRCLLHPAATPVEVPAMHLVPDRVETLHGTFHGSAQQRSCFCAPYSDHPLLIHRLGICKCTCRCEAGNQVTK